MERVTKRAIIILAITAAILIFPLAYYNGKGESQGYFGGSDDQGPAYMTAMGYKPWFNSVWKPPSPEIETLIFATQAAFGGLIIGYFLGYYRGMAKARKKDEAEDELDKKTETQVNR